MSKLRTFFAKGRLSHKTLAAILLLIALLLGSVTYARYYDSASSSGSQRVAAFAVTVHDGGIDIESGDTGADAWSLDLEEGDPAEPKEFTVHNNSEVDVRVVVTGAADDPHTLPNVTSSATESEPLVIDAGDSGVLTLTARPATTDQLGDSRSLTQQGIFTFDIRQVN